MRSVSLAQRAGYAVEVAILAAFLAAPLLVAKDTPTGPHAVVAPGQDALLADLLGMGADLPAFCTFAGGSVDGAVINATYECPAGVVALRLLHPEQVGPGVAQVAETEKFALVVTRGALPPPLLDELQARIRSREGRFEWTQPESPARPPAARPPRWIQFGECFFSLLIGGVLCGLWRSRKQLTTPEAGTVALIVIVALALRFVADAGPSDIRPVLGERVDAARAGWSAFVHLVYHFLPPQDETFWTINRIAGAFSTALLYLVLRARFSDPLIACAGAAALAVHPLITRFSASDSQYILVCAAFLGAVVAYDRYRESRSIGAFALAVGLLTAAMQLRPEAPWLVVPAILLALARPLPGWRVELLRPAVIACGMAFLALNAAPTVVATAGHMFGDYWRQFVLVGSALGGPWASAEMTPRTLTAFMLLGIAVALRHGRPGICWVAATLVAEPLYFPAYAHDHPALNYANARYHIPAVYLACGLAGLGVVGLLRWIARQTQTSLVATGAVAFAVLLLAALPGFGLLHHPWTPQREYALFRSGLRTIDAGCRIVTLEYTRDSGWAPFEYLVPNGLLDVSEFLGGDERGCAVYYRGGNCYTSDLVPESERAGFEMHPACRAIEERFRLEPIVEESIAAVPFRTEAYVRDPLPLGFYRLERKAVD